MRENFTVTGMTCSACSSHVEKSVNKLNGIKQVNVNLLSNSMAVDFDENILSTGDIIKAVVDSGYGAQLKSAAKKNVPALDAAEIPDEFAETKFRLITSLCFLIPLMYISMGHMMGLPLPSFFHGEKNALIFALTQFLLSIPIIFVNRKFFIGGFKALWRKSPNMDSLIAIGAGAAMLYGIIALYAIGYGLGHMDYQLVKQFSMDLYFESAATILTLITVGKMLEARSKNKTTDAITKLMDLSPKTAIVLRDNIETEIPVDEVIIGDIVIVRQGAAIPVDGTIIEGEGVVDESALTGESIPAEKVAGSKVTGATVNKAGYFKFKAEKVGDDTTLSEIIRLVQEASSTKAPIAKLADKVSGIFVPVVISVALAATIIWLLLGYGLTFALSIGIAVLVISCPCALGLATPTAIMVGTGKAAEHGILIKSAEALEALSHIDTVVLDKTGTITRGKPEVTDIIPQSGIEADALLSLAASVEKFSEHPLARSIVDMAEEKGLITVEANNFKPQAGRGVSVSISGNTVYAGNLAMMKELNIPINNAEQTANALAAQGKTPLFISDNKKFYGIIALADVAKPTSASAIAQLKAMGKKVIMLTGDNASTALAIKNIVGTDDVISDVLPQDKEYHVRLLQEAGHKVAMVGDGINDSPALARADVGIAIGAGTDIAIDSADIVLMRSDLADVSSAIQLSMATLKNIKQNLFWAFFYNTVGIPLAAGVLYIPLALKLNPMLGAAAMSLSSVCVVANALRLRFWQPKQTVQLSVTNNISTSQIERTGTQMNKKYIIIEGMSCGHCSARVEKALNELDGVSATVDLENKTASITLELEAIVSDDALKSAVTEAGYEVVSMSDAR